MREDKKHLTIQELAGIVGVSTSALRAWERRYSIFSPERTRGGHRLYTQEDLKLFWFVTHLRGQGRDLKEISTQGREDLLRQAQSFFELKTATPTPQANPASSPLPAPFEAILFALKKDNTDAAIRALEQVYALSNNALSFADSALDLMVQVGDAWHRGEITVAAEHALTSRLKHMLLGLFYLNDPDSDDSTYPHAVCATLPNEMHELGLLRVSLYLKTWGFKVTYLGANTPVVDLEEYCAKRNPALVIISCASSLNTNIMLQCFQKLGTLVAPLAPVVVGGSGVNAISDDRPEVSQVLLLRSMTHLERIARLAHANANVQPLERLKLLKDSLED